MTFTSYMQNWGIDVRVEEIMNTSFMSRMWSELSEHLLSLINGPSEILSVAWVKHVTADRAISSAGAATPWIPAKISSHIIHYLQLTKRTSCCCPQLQITWNLGTNGSSSWRPSENFGTNVTSLFLKQLWLNHFFPYNLRHGVIVKADIPAGFWWLSSLALVVDHIASPTGPSSALPLITSSC